MTIESLTLEEIRQQPALVSLEQAARTFPMSRWQAYELTRRGEFPVRVLKIGHRYRVRTLDLLEYVGAGPPDTARGRPLTNDGTTPQNTVQANQTETSVTQLHQLHQRRGEAS